MSITNDLIAALRRTKRGGVASSIYLTRPHTDQLLEEMGTRRDRRCTRRPPVDRFGGIPVYPDRDVSMVVFADSESRTGMVLL